MTGDDGVRRELSRVITSGDAMLFTGAGFSADARDLDGNALPDSRQMIGELWPLCFGEIGPPDESSLPDLYDVALLHAPDRLRAYVERRLRIGSTQLPAHYASWFGAPWKRIYTLNVDDLEVAVQRQFELPHHLRSVSAIISSSRGAPGTWGSGHDVIDVVHLNGIAGADASDLTFSTMQYAARLCGRDHEYERLAADLLDAPFVFAGTTLDEVVLWQHLELHRRRNGTELPSRPPSFLISPVVSRARQVLLESLRIRWIPSTIASIANDLLG